MRGPRHVLLIGLLIASVACVPAAASSAFHSVMSVWRQSTAPSVPHRGDRIRYAVLANGQQVGDEVAECTGLALDPSDSSRTSDWSITSSLSVIRDTTRLEVKSSGSYAIDSGSHVRHIRLRVSIGSHQQELAADMVTGAYRVKARVAVGDGGASGGSEQTFQRDIPTRAGDYLVLNELVTPLSQVFQAVRPAPGSTFELPAVRLNELVRAPIRYTVAAQPSEIQVGGIAHKCLLCSGSDGRQLWLDTDTRSIVRCVMPGGLSIERR